MEHLESSHIKTLGVAMHWNIWSRLILKDWVLQCIRTFGASHIKRLGVAIHWNIWSHLILND